ncbi:unnamed protein product, partial [marine sediment metagenome]
ADLITRHAFAATAVLIEPLAKLSVADGRVVLFERLPLRPAGDTPVSPAHDVVSSTLSRERQL